MSARTILTTMLETIRSELDAVKRADAPAVMEGVARHAELLGQLQEAEMDLSPEEARELVGQIERERLKLQSLLESQSARTDFLLRLILGGGKTQPVGYPGSGWGEESKPHRLNRRT